jgi:hypothetical protein
MKKGVIVILSFVFVFGLVSHGIAATIAQKKINLNVENISKAAEVIKRNQQLFSN